MPRYLFKASFWVIIQLTTSHTLVVFLPRIIFCTRAHWEFLADKSPMRSHPPHLPSTPSSLINEPVTKMCSMSNFNTDVYWWLPSPTFYLICKMTSLFIKDERVLSSCLGNRECIWRRQQEGNVFCPMLLLFRFYLWKTINCDPFLKH